MSVSKALLIASVCGIGLFLLTAVLTVMLDSSWPIGIVMISAPMAAGVVGGVRGGRADSKLWAMLSIAGVIAPLAWIILMAVSGV
jgi:hypothetical protein